MFPEIGGTEILLIAIVALIVVGPKDLPVMLRKLGQFMAKLRGMAAEFRASFDEMARQSELDELRKEVEAMRRGQFLDPDTTADVNRTFSDINQGLNEVGVDLDANRYSYAETPAAAIDEPAPALADPAEAAPAKKPRVRRKAAAQPVEASEPASVQPAPRKRAPAKRKPKPIVE